MTKSDPPQAADSELVVVLLNSVDEDRDLVRELMAGGMRAIALSLPLRMMSIREQNPALIIADLELGGRSTQQLILDCFDGSLPHELGVLLLAPSRVIPDFLEPITHRFVGWVHKDVGVGNVVRMAQSILRLRGEARSYLASATELQQAGGNAARSEYLKGRYYQVLGDYEAAVTQYRKSLLIDESSRDTHRSLAEVLSKSRR